MNMHLVVVKPFSRFHPGGTSVTDDVRVSQILRSEQAAHVVRVVAPYPRRRAESMPIVQQGSINTTALVVPDLYVQIVPPQNLVLNGVPTNIVGVSWARHPGDPIGQPVIAATMTDYAQTFGPIIARKYDMGTQVATAVQQGAQNFRCVRVTDGTDTAAQAAVPNTTFVFHWTVHRVSWQSDRVDDGTRFAGWYLAADGRTSQGSLPRFTTTLAVQVRSFLDRVGQCSESGPGLAAWSIPAGHREC